jgi:hypothetical protein
LFFSGAFIIDPLLLFQKEKKNHLEEERLSSGRRWFGCSVEAP